MQDAVDISIFTKVARAVGQTIRVDTSGLSNSTRLVGDLLLGRLRRMELAIHLEEMFDVEFEDDTVLCFETLGDIVEHLSYRYFRDVEPSVLAAAA